MMRRAVDSYLHLPRSRYFSAIEWHAIAIGSIAGVVLFAGYGFNLAVFQSLIPGFPTMKPATAASLMALSLSFLLSLRQSRRARWASIAIALAIVVGLAYMRFGLAVGSPSQPWQAPPSDATIFSIYAAAAGLLIINIAPNLPILAGVLAFAATAPAIFRILALALFGGVPDPTSPLNSMALHTAFLIAWFMLVCLMLHPRLGFARAILQPSLRGRLLRRALPAIVLLPVLAGVASLAFSMMLGWPDEVLFAASAALSVAFGAGLIWWLSRLIEVWQDEANEHAFRLSRINEALEQYASSAAHDLKAPARHVLLYGELLHEALAKGDVDAARRQARCIRDAASELPATIDGLLDYSRSSASTLAPADHKLTELVQAAVSMQEGDIETAGAEIFIDREAELWCDASRMTVVFQILIANSIRHRRKDRPLEIRIDAARTGVMWTISVADNGVGFEPDDAVVAFNPLARGVARAGDPAGIGLAACGTIVRSHGGEIRVDAGFREGARIEMRLPAKSSLKTKIEGP